MANPQRGEVAIEVDGKAYTLKLGHNALATAEKLLGMGFQRVVTALNDPEQQSIHMLMVIVWAGLQRHHAGITLDDVGDMFDEAGDAYMGARVTEALQLTFGKAEAAENPR